MSLLVKMAVVHVLATAKIAGVMPWKIVRMNKRQKALYEQSSERDEGICQLCGCRSVDIHHIIPAGMGRKRTNEIYNMISLCRGCHDKAHKTRQGKECCIDWSRERYGKEIDKLIMRKRG